MTRILLGTAGHEGSEAAAAWAADLARLLRGELEIVKGYERRSAEEAPEVAREERQRAAAELDRWASAHQLAGVALRTMPRSPHEAISQAADDRHADIVVIGSKPVEGETSLGLGSVAHRLAHHLTCPMIVVPPDAPPLGRGTVVIGVDGSRGSDQALQWGVRLGRDLDGPVVAVFAIDKFYGTFQSSGSYGSGERWCRRQARLTDGIELVERGGPDPAATLRAVADERSAALIVVSTKHRHSLGGRLLGSTADHLLHQPTRPVAVVPTHVRSRTHHLRRPRP